MPAGVHVLARHNIIVRGLLERFRGREVATTGDGFVANFDGAERGYPRRTGDRRDAWPTWAWRSVQAYTTGELELEGEDVRGLNVHIAARVMALARPGEVCASWATRELLAGSSIGFEDRGLHEMKGLEDERRVYLVEHRPDGPGNSRGSRPGTLRRPDCGAIDRATEDFSPELHRTLDN